MSRRRVVAVGGVKVIVECVEVADPLDLHIRDDTGVDEREPLTSAEDVT
jgi:hypothetical protein